MSRGKYGLSTPVGVYMNGNVCTPEGIQVVMEGICPICGDDMEVTSMGGLQEWLDNFGWVGVSDDKIQVWKGSSDYTVGCIIQKCPAGHVFTAHINSFGEWSVSKD